MRVVKVIKSSIIGGLSCTGSTGDCCHNCKEGRSIGNAAGKIQKYLGDLTAADLCRSGVGGRQHALQQYGYESCAVGSGDDRWRLRRPLGAPFD